MKSILAFVKHVVWAMIKGFVFTGVGAAVLSFGALVVTDPKHTLGTGTEDVLAAVLSILAAFLGSAVALIYHLSHIEEISHSLKRAAEARQAARQQARTK